MCVFSSCCFQQSSELLNVQLEGWCPNSLGLGARDVDEAIEKVSHLSVMNYNEVFVCFL